MEGGWWLERGESLGQTMSVAVNMEFKIGKNLFLHCALLMGTGKMARFLPFFLFLIWFLGGVGTLIYFIVSTSTCFNIYYAA